MYAQTGKKLLFMGCEFGQWREWSHDQSLDWHLTHQEPHAGMQRWVRDLNHLYREQPAMHAREFDPAAFEWIDCCDVENSVVSLIRHGHMPEDDVVVVCNFTPVPRYRYRMGVPEGGYWRELLNSDAPDYGGSGIGNYGGVWAQDEVAHGRPHSVVLDLPPLSALFFKREPEHS
jgi:1,4-alpha-glucan branching enzyme